MGVRLSYYFMSNFSITCYENYKFEPPLTGFKVYELGINNHYASHSRNDCFKICMVSGFTLVKNEHQITLNDGTLLLLGSPSVQYTYEAIRPLSVGYACVFTAQFMCKHYDTFSPEHQWLLQSGALKLIKLTELQRDGFSNLFKRLLSAVNEEYRYVEELVLVYLQTIMHEALKAYLTNISG